MAKHPVKIELEDANNLAIDLEVKRFYVPGYILKTMCPKCGAAYERDFGEYYLSYPTANTPFEETLYCTNEIDEETCGHEWDVTLQIDLSLKVV